MHLLLRREETILRSTLVHFSPFTGPDWIIFLIFFSFADKGNDRTLISLH